MTAPNSYNTGYTTSFHSAQIPPKAELRMVRKRYTNNKLTEPKKGKNL